MNPSRSPAAGLGLLALLGSLGGCSDRSDAPPPAAAPFATARHSDPALTESWRLPEGSSPLRTGDLGSTPVALSRALMNEHAAAGISHRIATRCSERGALANLESLALRFVVGADGTLASIEGDPAGAAAGCTADALRAEISARPPLPAGAALMVLRFWVEPAP